MSASSAPFFQSQESPNDSPLHPTLDDLATDAQSAASESPSERALNASGIVRSNLPTKASGHSLADLAMMGNMLNNYTDASKDLKAVFYEILEGNDITPGPKANYDEVEDARGCFSVLAAAVQQYLDNTLKSTERTTKISAGMSHGYSVGKQLPSSRFDTRAASPMGRTQNSSVLNMPSAGGSSLGNTGNNSEDTGGFENFRFGSSPTPSATSETLGMTQQNLWSSYASLAPEIAAITAETSKVVIQHDDEGNKLINDYEVIDTVGQGGFAKVKVAVRKSDNKTVAIKVMKKSLLRKARQGAGMTAWEQVQTEIAIMKKMRHKNVVTLYEVIDDPSSNKLYLIMQYCERGPLLKLKEDGTCVPLEDELCRGFLRQAVSGLHYLHRHNVIHRDIKPDNILRGQDDEIFLTDFGVSEMMQEDEDNDGEIEGQQGTPPFFSPELCRGEGGVHGKAVDVWALGVTFYAFVFGKLPFYGDSVLDIMDSIQNNSLSFPPNAPDDWVDLLKGMLNKDPRKRLSLPEVRHHWVLTGIAPKPKDSNEPKGYVGRMRRMTEYDVITVNEDDVRGAIAIGSDLQLMSPSAPAPPTASGPTTSFLRNPDELASTTPGVGNNHHHSLVNDLRAKVSPNRTTRSSSPEMTPAPPSMARPASAASRHTSPQGGGTRPERGPSHVKWTDSPETNLPLALANTFPSHSRTETGGSQRSSLGEPPELGSTLSGHDHESADAPPTDEDSRRSTTVFQSEDF